MIKRTIFAILSLLVVFSQPALALSNKPGSDPTGKSQRQIIEQTPWLDPTACENGPAAPSPTGGGPASPGQTWFMGDSLTYGLKDFGGLEDKLTAKGFTPNFVNDRGGRAINSPGGGGPGQEPGTGLETVDNNADFIRDSKNIVIALGTNDANIAGGTTEQIMTSFGNNQKALIEKLKALPLQSGVKIFWVDVAAVGVNKAGAEAVNTVIYNNAQSLGYTPISQFKFVWGQDQDPKQIANKSLPDPNGLLSSDGIHYAGGTKYQDYANFLVDQLTSGGGSTATSPTTTVSGPCSCGSGNQTSTTNLTGDDVVEQAYNFYVQKGLTPAQSAGIVGNLMLESGGNTTINPDITNNIGAFGIAQWLGGRRTALEAYAASQGKPRTDLGIQLEFLWSEIPANVSVSTRKNYLDSTDTNSTPSEAAIAFEDTFERSGGDAIPQRVSNAESVFASFGSNTPSPSGNSGQTGTGSCGGGGSDSTIDSTLPQGTREELYQKIQDSGKITANVNLLGNPGMKTTILAVILRLTEKYSFSIGSTVRSCTCPHANGSAVDLGNINGEGVPTGEDYEAFNQIAADFVKDAATLLPAGGSYMGVSNERFKSIAEPIITSKAGSILIETRANGLAQGAHFHLNVPAGAP